MLFRSLTSHTIVPNAIITTNRNTMNSSIANSTRLKELAWVKQKENNRGHFSTDEANNHIYNIGHHSLRPITGSHADRLLFQHIKHNHLLLPSTSVNPAWSNVTACVTLPTLIKFFTVKFLIVNI